MELTDFQWTINDVLAQPEEILDAVFSLKSVGERVRKQSSAYHDKDVEKV